MNWRDLIVIARALAIGVIPPRIGRPRQAELRRALSTIYYAAFHAFASNNANTLIGIGPQVRNDPAWELTYRAMDHRAARARCEHPAMSRFPTESGKWLLSSSGCKHDVTGPIMHPKPNI